MKKNLLITYVNLFDESSMTNEKNCSALFTLFFSISAFICHSIEFVYINKYDRPSTLFNLCIMHDIILQVMDMLDIEFELSYISCFRIDLNSMLKMYVFYYIELTQTNYSVCSTEYT